MPAPPPAADPARGGTLSPDRCLRTLIYIYIFIYRFIYKYINTGTYTFLGLCIFLIYTGFCTNAPKQSFCTSDRHMLFCSNTNVRMIDRGWCSSRRSCLECPIKQTNMYIRKKKTICIVIFICISIFYSPNRSLTVGVLVP